jgi:hypothetical protein
MELNKKYIGWALVVLAILIAGYLGVSYPIPAPPPPAPAAGAGSQSLSVVRFNQAVQFLMPAAFSGSETHSGIETHSGAATFVTITTSALISQSIGFNATGSSNFMTTTINGPAIVSGTLNVSDTMSIAGVSFTGPIKYGTSSSYVSGARIAHGFATSPTVCMLWPAEITATLTITSTGFSSNSAAHSNPIYWMCAK